MAGLDATETGNKLSQPKFKFISLLVSLTIALAFSVPRYIFPFVRKPPLLLLRLLGERNDASGSPFGWKSSTGCCRPWDRLCCLHKTG